VVLTLTILGAETSLGDPDLGGDLIRSGSCNYGCMKYAGRDTPWGALSSGKVRVAGADWYTFPSPEVGMRAWGLLIAHGPTWKPGFYLSVYPDWGDIASVYFGKDVAGFAEYVAGLKDQSAKFSKALKDAGFTTK